MHSVAIGFAGLSDHQSGMIDAHRRDAGARETRRECNARPAPDFEHALAGRWIEQIYRPAIACEIRAASREDHPCDAAEQTAWSFELRVEVATQTHACSSVRVSRSSSRAV